MEELDKGRRLARRRMAWLSFFYLLLVSTAIIGGILVGGVAVATAFSTASTLVIGLITVFTSIILGYLGVSVAENLFKK